MFPNAAYRRRNALVPAVVGVGGAAPVPRGVDVIDRQVAAEFPGDGATVFGPASATATRVAAAQRGVIVLTGRTCYTVLRGHAPIMMITADVLGEPLHGTPGAFGITR